jgi:hypothetical protein
MTVRHAFVIEGAGVIDRESPSRTAIITMFEVATQTCIADGQLLVLIQLFVVVTDFGFWHPPCVRRLKQRNSKNKPLKKILHHFADANYFSFYGCKNSARENYELSFQKGDLGLKLLSEPFMRTTVKKD